MKKLILLCFSFLCLTQTGIGQELYREGFILTSPFDTTRGQIKYYSYNKAAIQCVFRNGDTGEEKVYQPEDIYGYGIEDKLLFNSKQIDNKQAVFLEVIYEGTMRLYGYRDRFRRNYFYLENTTTGDFEALTEKVIGDKLRNRVFKPYLDVLKLMLDKSDLILDRIEKTALTHKSLTNLLVEYDKRYANFKGKVLLGSKEQWPPTTGFYLIQGNAQQKLGDYSGTGNSYLAGVGVKFQKEISRGTKRLYLDLDLSLSYESFSQTYKRTEEVTDQSIVTNGLNFAFISTNTDIRGDVDHETTVDLRRLNLGMPINIKYVFPGKKWLFTINSGINPQHALTKSGQIHGVLRQNESVLIDITSQEDTERFRMAVNVGFGIQLKTQRTYFLDFQHSPSWFNQGILKYKYSFVRIGLLLDK
ncbi:hypothetical protein BFP97_08100 [Roseivirga sp. 4D4]|uniref:hypothetical protein n=1 Tax=Roseivirga sp. 4D4 TaxID=1889784 RepID=UPI000852AB6E|nr:hypothetical protein [Roseivirga sp. 4D4]OEK01484.1 hypothetical protein BFP97_08100 [Roseivirga sp. 4D4]